MPKPKTQNTQKLNQLLDQDLTIDQCVAKNHEDCRRVKWKYNQFLCGNAPVCTGHSEAEKKKAVSKSTKSTWKESLDGINSWLNWGDT